MEDAPPPSETETNFLDRAAYYDGRLDGLLDATNAFTTAVAAIEAVGPTPATTARPAEILNYQVRVATACGTVFRRLGAELEALARKARDEREILMRDRSLLEGGSMQ